MTPINSTLDPSAASRSNPSSVMTSTPAVQSNPPSNSKSLSTASNSSDDPSTNNYSKVGDTNPSTGMISAQQKSSPTTPTGTMPKTAPVNNNVSLMTGKLAAVDLSTLSFMILNFVSSTAIVVTNKIVMDKYGFKFATTLTAFHLVCTFILLLISSKVGLFEIKKLPIRDVSKLAAGTMGFICLTNLSLQHNSMGFYQVMKVMTTPTVVIIESLFYQKYLENNLKVSLLPVCLGVIITVATDFRLNLVGSLYAIFGVVVTSLYQIWSGTLQRSLDCNGLQLQTYVSPLAALFVLPFIPVLDNYSLTKPDSIWLYKFNNENLPIILITGLFGFLVNISIFLVIGRSSALSYNILGHCKTVVVLLSDYIFFGRPANFKSSFGIILTLIGIFWYTSLKLEKAKLEKEARERAPPPPKVIDDEQDSGSNEEGVRLVDSRNE